MYQGLLFWFMTFVDHNHNNADAMKSQVKFQMSLQGIEKQKKEIKVIFPPKFLQSFVVDGFDTCKHISFVEPNNVWVSDISNNLIFTNTKCKNIHHVNHIGRGHVIHTVNSDNELIYMITRTISRNCQAIPKRQQHLLRQHILSGEKHVFSGPKPLRIYWLVWTY